MRDARTSEAPSASTSLGGTIDDAAYLRTTRAIRERAAMLFSRAEAGQSTAFSVHMGELGRAADYVADVARGLHPTLAVPMHGRTRHFDTGGKARTAILDARLGELSARERARTKIDLLVPSVLLDAGAGDRWAYTEDGVRIPRSEGLAVASLHLFLQGGLAGDGESLRADARGLAAIDAARIRTAFQVGPDNPLVAVEGRAALLARLGAALERRPDLFGAEGRPGGLFDTLEERAESGAVRAADVLGLLLEGFSTIWPGRFAVAGTELGDAWPHPSLGDVATAASVLPFHKLSQWMTYSLVEPLHDGGLRVVGLEDLSGLAEYRSGGLFLDLGVLRLRDEVDASRSHRVGDPLVVEWRALTVSLLERLGPLVRERLELVDPTKDASAFIVGGAWAAGRKSAAERRPGASPPLSIESDGTVF